MPGSGRFAPSPSAPLHLGNLRTALLAWLAARRAGGAFHLRIDDLDAGRSRPELAESQLRDLALLGLDHDGAVPRQSDRLERYADALARLEAEGLVYPCFCTRAEVREASGAPHGAPTDGYPGTCRGLTPAMRAARLASGRAPSLRFRADGAPQTIDDLVLGPKELTAEDVVLRRGDGAFGYQLAVVVDDADQGVDEVVRGADLLGSSATQRAIGDALDLPRVGYAHVPLMVGDDGARLAKRHGAASLADALEGRSGVGLPGLRPGCPTTPRELVGALAATIGLAEAGETPTLSELTDRFAFDRLPRRSTMMERCPG